MRMLLFFGVGLACWCIQTRADFQPFDHNVKCQSRTDASALHVTYDKSEFPEFGWQGGIHLTLETGNNRELSEWIKTAAIAESGENKVVRRRGPAGQVGNWIEQDKNNPFNLNLKIGFTAYELIDSAGSVKASANSFISELKMKKLSTGEYAVRLTDDFGGARFEFAEGECEVVN